MLKKTSIKHINSEQSPKTNGDINLPRSADFFAGSGLVSEAMRGIFSTVWANDICEKKSNVFVANHSSDIFHLGSVEQVDGNDLPNHELSWASFPCQDLSVAGNQNGINAKRSGMVWQWLRVLDEVKQRPKVVVAENVVGLITSKNGENYLALHEALIERGYNVGTVLLDAINWVPQSRPRIFVIGVKSSIPIDPFIRNDATWCHNDAIKKVAKLTSNWIWWNLPQPPKRTSTIEAIINFQAPVFDDEKTRKHLELIPKQHLEKMLECTKYGQKVFPGYKRMRKGKQVLELRFDGIAGCLRTPSGGSSRQFVVIYNGKDFNIRLLTVRETARLMGASDSFSIPGSYNDGYRAMGDAVALPAARYLAKELLAKIASI
ncbi:DNA (cytosine-5-)-methyltransferase [Shewanella sp. NFH-SH190041]|uniref:DNA cytosine methyltransferase n=1 Tax=Shewanella sp. NFH-SH190041 TaxID=2950245 RepID=UPI0021C28CC9|nr:DNA cytosine methyltransferase [Shewanella sp. NFH-SH190041]BDM63238.1 DNA (cytosine-5-)-methyltransferase [Shewanella sp. NFH-SH190041]